ncbi:HNH endonuclease signature motif containing protein [Candidatus Poriferisodalis sp.]|uniref:HNH endonuclease signature motif containing protein n=1 Tax=Candidatus Poriferisodalis sp. TaxID=3101277 RepID=UPI003C7044AD
MIAHADLLPRSVSGASSAAVGADPAGGKGDANPSGDADLAGLSHGELVDVVVSLVAERARVEGRYLAALGELATRDGAQATAWQLREYTRMNSAQARSESRLAEGLAEHDMTATVEALQAGEIQISHAKVIAREAPKQPRRSEEEFLELCQAYPSDVIARHSLAYQTQQVYADLAAEAAAEGRELDPIDAELAFQRAERSGSMRLGDDGMWHLHAKLDFIAGREVSQAIQAQVRAARQRDGAEDLTRAQLTADAGCDLTSEHTQAHHIQYYEHDGLTDIPNLASLCEPCHRDLHQHHWAIETPPDGRPRMQPPGRHPTSTPRSPPPTSAGARSP